MATYYCNPGFLLWGSSHRTCSQGGQWTGSLPSCRRISCGEPPWVENSAREPLDNSVVTYSCLPGYTTQNGIVTFPPIIHPHSLVSILSKGSVGEFQSICQDNGTWSYVGISCKPPTSAGRNIWRYLLGLSVAGACLFTVTSSVLGGTAYLVRTR